MSDVPDAGNYVPIDCPICLMMMRDAGDVTQYYASKCCVDCWIGFLEPLRLLKRDPEYLPNSTELKAYRDKIDSMNNLEKKSVEPKRN